MDDQTKPSITSFRSMVFTGVGSATVGDQIGKPLADIITFLIQSIAAHYNLPIPGDISGELHSVILALIVGLAFATHYQVVKPKETTN